MGGYMFYLHRYQVIILGLFILNNLLNCSRPEIDTYNVPTPDNQTVTDVDGNTYTTVQIGGQVWMAENLRTTHYKDGTNIPNISEAPMWINVGEGAYCYYKNEIDYFTWRIV
jgi:hypothetical protein